MSTTSTAEVRTAYELKKAVEAKASVIAIQDDRLAWAVYIIKNATEVSLKAALLAASFAVFVAAVPVVAPFLGPFGAGLLAKGAGDSVLVLAWAVAFLLGTIGVNILYEIYTHYYIKSDNTFERPDGTKNKAKLILKRKN
jgi:hypothetical protein